MRISGDNITTIFLLGGIDTLRVVGMHTLFLNCGVGDFLLCDPTAPLFYLTRVTADVFQTLPNLRFFAFKEENAVFD